MGLRLAELAPSCSSHTKECETKYYYSVTSPLGHLFSRNSSIQRKQNLVPEKRSHNICIVLPLLKGPERDTFSRSREKGFFNFNRGDTLAPGALLSTRKVTRNKSKS